eukprot:scaffold48169_cov72-Phaeocystis_antarctica.AAC.3
MFRFATHPRRARTRARGRPRPLGDSVTASPRGCLRLRPRANLGDTPIAACSQTASTLSPHVPRVRAQQNSVIPSQPEFMPPLPLEVFKDVLLPAAGSCCPLCTFSSSCAKFVRGTHGSAIRYIVIGRQHGGFRCLRME